MLDILFFSPCGPWHFSYIKKWFRFQPSLFLKRVSVFESVANLESGLGPVGSVQFALDNKLFYRHVSLHVDHP